MFYLFFTVYSSYHLPQPPPLLRPGPWGTTVFVVLFPRVLTCALIAHLNSRVCFVSINACLMRAHVIMRPENLETLRQVQADYQLHSSVATMNVMLTCSCLSQALPSSVVVVDDEFDMPIQIKTVTHTHTEHYIVPPTSTVQAPSNTRRVASPTPNIVSSSSTDFIPRTTQLVKEEIIESVEPPVEVYEEIEEERSPMRRRKRPQNKKWFGGW